MCAWPGRLEAVPRLDQVVVAEVISIVAVKYLQVVARSEVALLDGDVECQVARSLARECPSKFGSVRTMSSAREIDGREWASATERIWKANTSTPAALGLVGALSTVCKSRRRRCDVGEDKADDCCWSSRSRCD